ncbi:MAG TPA: fatty acid desaturase [Dongiaceae bacterium]|nr:fatty acid desaturase [Dongiaceae bacterium]
MSTLAYEHISDNVWVLLVLCVLTLALRAIVSFYYRDHDRILGLTKLSAVESGKYYKMADSILAPLPFLWCWVDIFIGVLFAHAIGSVWAYAALVVFVGGRFRALQEVGHNAVHCALCRSRDWQWFLSDFFFQFPIFKRDMHSRYITHVVEHHRNPNVVRRDPNLARVAAGGVVPGLSAPHFFLKLLYPLTLGGFWANLKLMMINSFLENRSKRGLLVRFISLATVTTLMEISGGYKAVLAGYILPLLITYPLYAWISLLAEHRWYAPSHAIDRFSRECENCRPTDFPGFLGWITRCLIFPTSDAYHLAHSLYPYIRWNHLPAIDQALKQQSPRGYARYRSEGLFFAKPSGPPAALSELRDRLAGKNHVILAEWAKEFALCPRMTCSDPQANSR